MSVAPGSAREAHALLKETGGSRQYLLVLTVFALRYALMRGSLLSVRKTVKKVSKNDTSPNKRADGTNGRTYARTDGR